MRIFEISAITGIVTLMGCAFDPVCGPERNAECEFVDAQPSGSPDMNTQKDPGQRLNNSRLECAESSECSKNTRSDAIELDEDPLGCVHDDFKRTSAAVVDAVCHDSALWYVARTNRCSRNSFILEGHLGSEVPACLDDVELILFDSAGFRICDSDIARCERQEDGSHVARVIVRQGSPSDNYYFLVESNTSFAAPFTFTVRTLP